MAVQQSTVKWFDAKKGYGFILHPEDGSDVFVHYSQVISDKRFKTLRTGEIVEFELFDGPKGVHAHQVVSLGEPEESSAEAADVSINNTAQDHPPISVPPQS